MKLSGGGCFVVIALLVLGSAMVASGCGGSSSPKPCSIGSLGCSCSTGGGCDPGLVCYSNLCVNRSPTGAGDAAPLGTAGSSNGPGGVGGIDGGGANAGGRNVMASGGFMATSGMTGAGGVTSSGGLVGAGGVIGTGGMTNSGGVAASGGSTSAGGTTAAGGGATSAGGITAAGGAVGRDAAQDVQTSSGGASGSGGGPPSCASLTATCGTSSESCCKSLLVPGGTYYRSYDAVADTDMGYSATVSSFYLDKYLITVGRFRQFANAGMGTQANPPAAGAGANPLITGSGWDATWNTNLSVDTAGLEAAVKCDSGYQRWTDAAGSNESQPMNCLNWYTAFAFCAWDGGRLPTEGEWNYAASGGGEQRYYPWSSPATSTTIGDSYAVYCGGSCSGTQNVGSKSPKGDGLWGQSDLAGNLWEWMLDWYDTYQMPCNNCADITDASASLRVLRGGDFYVDASNLRSAVRNSNLPKITYSTFGGRCARTGP